jgi:hypothetical protein
MELQTETLVIAAVGFIVLISILITLYCFNDGIEYWIRTHTEAGLANRRLKRLYKHFIVHRRGNDCGGNLRRCVYKLLSTEDYYEFIRATSNYRYYTRSTPSVKLPRFDMVSFDTFIKLRRYETGTK